MGGNEGDRLVWPSTKEKGSNKHRKAQPSSNVVDEKVSKWIWSILALLKIKHFLWRVCKNFIATNRNLWMKKIREDLVCPICGIEDETTEHVLLLCD